MWRLILALFVIGAGYWMGQPPKKKEIAEFPLVEHKSFVIILYAQNDALWIKRSLRSIFEQDYDHYRVVVIDDGSVDDTFLLAKEYTVENAQESKVILIQNDKPQGKEAATQRVIKQALAKEIILPLDKMSWLASPQVLDRLNRSFQNPEVHRLQAEALHYPSYEIQEGACTAYYASDASHPKRAYTLTEPLILSALAREQPEPYRLYFQKF